MQQDGVNGYIGKSGMRQNIAEMAKQKSNPAIAY